MPAKKSTSKKKTAAKKVPEDLYKWQDRPDGTIIITKCYDQHAVIEIPASINGKTVVGLDNNVFAGRKTLKELIFPPTITNILRRAFRECINLNKVTLPKNISNIDKEVFYGCTSLESLVIPDGVTLIGDAAFKNCHNLSEIVLPNSIKYIEKEAFRSCKSLKSINLPDSLEIVDDFAFAGCENLTEIVLPHSVKRIGTSAFINCRKLISITLPNSLEEIGENLFGTRNLEKLKFEYTKEFTESEHYNEFVQAWRLLELDNLVRHDLLLGIPTIE